MNTLTEILVAAVFSMMFSAEIEEKQEAPKPDETEQQVVHVETPVDECHAKEE